MEQVALLLGRAAALGGGAEGNSSSSLPTQQLSLRVPSSVVLSTRHLAILRNQPPIGICSPLEVRPVRDVSVDQSPTEGLAAQSYGWSRVYRGIWKYCDKSTDRVLDGAVSQ